MDAVEVGVELISVKMQMLETRVRREPLSGCDDALETTARRRSRKCC